MSGDAEQNNNDVDVAPNLRQDATGGAFESFDRVFGIDPSTKDAGSEYLGSEEFCDKVAILPTLPEKQAKPSKHKRATSAPFGAPMARALDEADIDDTEGPLNR